MTAAIGHPTLRLVRRSIANLELGDLPLGQWRAIAREEIQWGTTANPDADGVEITTASGVPVRYVREARSSATQPRKRGQPTAAPRRPGAWFNKKK